MASADPVVLITGVGRYLGGRVAARLSADQSIGRLIAIDTVPPAVGTLGRAEFVRADIRNPLIGKMLDQAQVSIVVHVGVTQPRATRVTPRDDKLAGVIALMAACEQSESVKRVIATSSTAVYGASRHDPAVFTESMSAAEELAPGPARDAAEVEKQLRYFARRRPDVTVSVLRLASLIGPTVDSWLTRYLALPIVPTSLGRDPRVQLLHEADAVEAIHRTVAESHPGVTNVAADGVVTLAQVLRQARRLSVPIPGVALGAIRFAVGSADTPAEVAGFLDFGRVVDTTRLKTRLGYTPSYTTLAALRDYLDAHPRLPDIVWATVSAAHRSLVRRGGLSW